MLTDPMTNQRNAFRQTYSPRPLLRLPRWAWSVWHWL
jgi:hypothetical protein